METVGLILFGLGGLVAFAGSIWLLVVAFQEHILWGLGCLFVPFVALVFVIMHWAAAWRPFVVSLGGSAVAVVGVVLSGLSAQEMNEAAHPHPAPAAAVVMA